MEFDFPHSLPREDARARLQALGEYLNSRHGIQVSWTGDRGSFRGKYMVVDFEGELTLGEQSVHFRGKDPGFLLRKKAMSYLQEKLAKYLDPRTTLEKLPRS